MFWKWIVLWLHKNVNMYNLAGLENESKMNFHFVNGFRVYHKKPAWIRVSLVTP